MPCPASSSTRCDGGRRGDQEGESPGKWRALENIACHVTEALGEDALHRQVSTIDCLREQFGEVPAPQDTRAVSTLVQHTSTPVH